MRRNRNSSEGSLRLPSSLKPYKRLRLWVEIGIARKARFARLPPSALGRLWRMWVRLRRNVFPVCVCTSYERGLICFVIVAGVVHVFDVGFCTSTLSPMFSTGRGRACWLCALVVFASVWSRAAAAAAWSICM